MARILRQFTTAMNSGQAGAPNSQHKKEYLHIYSDITRANDDLIRFLVHLNGRGETSRLLAR